MRQQEQTERLKALNFGGKVLLSQFMELFIDIPEADAKCKQGTTTWKPKERNRKHWVSFVYSRLAPWDLTLNAHMQLNCARDEDYAYKRRET